MLSAVAVEGLPEVQPGDDLAGLIAGAAGAVAEDDVLVVAHKIVSKAEGRLRVLSEVAPGARAVELANELGKDARHVQVILDESKQVLRASRGVLICLTRHGFVCANAGVDASNVPGDDAVVLARDELPDVVHQRRIDRGPVADHPLVELERVAVGAAVSELISTTATALPAGARVVVEKPFGRNLASAQGLNRALRRVFP